MQKWKLGQNVYASGTRFLPCFGTALRAQSVISNKKIPHRSPVRSLLRVRCWLGHFLLPCHRSGLGGACVVTDCHMDLAQCPTNENNGIGDLRCVYCTYMPM